MPPNYSRSFFLAVQGKCQRFNAKNKQKVSSNGFLAERGTSKIEWQPIFNAAFMANVKAKLSADLKPRKENMLSGPSLRGATQVSTYVLDRPGCFSLRAGDSHQYEM
jgi:hypothetical protein